MLLLPIRIGEVKEEREGAHFGSRRAAVEEAGTSLSAEDCKGRPAMNLSAGQPSRPLLSSEIHAHIRTIKEG